MSNSDTQSEALNAAQEVSDLPQSVQSEYSSEESDLTSESSREHFILCFGLYDEENNAVEVYCSSTDSGIVSLYESGVNNEWTKITDVSENESYSYKITEDFKEKKIKAVQETADGKLESAAFSVVFSDGKYICEMSDSDNDKVFDFQEKIYGTDPDNSDTDGDGFSDYDEIVVLKTDPLVKNEDGDLDGDGLSDKKELELGTDPRDADTDGDGLSDFDELNKYKTDPLNADTDGDTVIDGAEIAMGLDPNNTATFGVPDAEYKTKQIIDADSDSLKIVNKKDSPFTLSLEITASGDVSGSLIAGRSGYATVIQSDNQIGEAIELRYDGGEIDEVVLHFQIADEYVRNELNLYPDVEELHGVKRFNIFKYFEDINMLLPIETTIDTQTNTISSTVDELGTYCVIDLEKWFKNIEEFADMQSE
ncbi:MAG: hypothetical protein K2N38_04500 [Oscillospiraceae bacterium]|nr:hypothetical protein [Oscillospiraceae bacterium]